MQPEEKPPEDSNSDETIESSNDHLDGKSSETESVQPADAHVVEAEVVQASPFTAELAAAGVPGGVVAGAAATADYRHITTPDIDENLDNISANGGAVGALVLGIWSLVGSFITNWSIINGVLGLLMGFWGLTSRKRKMAWIGIALCILSIFLSLIQVSDIVNTYWNAADESQ